MKFTLITLILSFVVFACVAHEEKVEAQAVIVDPKDNHQWIEFSPDKMTEEWEIKQNGFNSRRLSKKAQKKFYVEGDAFVVESEYQSIGKYLCSKKSFDDFILEAEFQVNDLRSCAFIGYHAQFLETQWKKKGPKYLGLHSFTYGFGKWPKTTGEAEIRYMGAGKSLDENHKEVQIQKDTWHKVKVVVQDDAVQHWFDGQLVAEFKDANQTLRSKGVKSEEPMKGPIVLGMPGHPKGQKHNIKVKWRGVRVLRL